MVSTKKRQLGAFLMARWVLLMLILVGMLVIPIWLKKNHDANEKERAEAKAKTERDMNATYMQPIATASPASTAPRAIGHGLTFALRAPNENLPPDVATLSCDGEPKPSDKPEKDACNPRQGDTSCSVVLPVLCLKSSGFTNPAQPNYNAVGAWTAGTLGATAPVMGAILESKEIADARCEKELGEGYRMADRYAGGDGVALRGRPGQGLSMGGNTRYWVAAKGDRANCWDSAP